MATGLSFSVRNADRQLPKKVKAPAPIGCPGAFVSHGRIRTGDLQISNPLLYPLSYTSSFPKR